MNVTSTPATRPVEKTVSLAEALNKQVTIRPKDGQHTVYLKAFTLGKSPAQNPADIQEYLVFELVVVDDKNKIIKETFFARNEWRSLNIAIAQIAAQLSIEDMPISDFLTKLTAEQTQFQMWLDHETVPNRNGDAIEVAKIRFREPLKLPTVETTAQNPDGTEVLPD